SPSHFADGQLARAGRVSLEWRAFRRAGHLLHVHRAAPDGRGARVRVLLADAFGGDFVCALLPARIPERADAGGDRSGVHRGDPDAGLPSQRRTPGIKLLYNLLKRMIVDIPPFPATGGKK